MEQRPSWEAKSASASREHPHILQNPNFNYCVHNSPPLNHILSHSNPVQNLSFYFFKTNFNIILPSTTRSCKWSLYLKFSHHNPTCIASAVYVLHALLSNLTSTSYTFPWCNCSIEDFCVAHLAYLLLSQLLQPPSCNPHDCESSLQNWCNSTYEHSDWEHCALAILLLYVANSNTINISISKYTFNASWGFKIPPLPNFVLKSPTRIQILHSVLRELVRYLL